MTHLLSALPAVLATARWRLQGRGGALAALLGWVWATNVARWILWPYRGQGVVLILLDLLWQSWYVAHVIARRRGVFVHLGGATMLATLVQSILYLERGRTDAAFASRLRWLTVSGGGWAVAAIYFWTGAAAGADHLVGLMSCTLSIVQVITGDAWTCPAIGYSAASLILIISIMKGKKENERRLTDS